MKIRKSGKYKNYGPIPRNEYNTTNKKESTNSAADLEHATQEDETAYIQRSPKQHSQYQPRRGWKRSAKVNGWRAELASQQEKSVGTRRYYNYVIGKNSTPLNKKKPVNGQKKYAENEAITMYCFNTEEINLICIYKADTRGETLSNMQTAQSYIDDQDILAVLGSAVNKLKSMTDIDFTGIVFDQTCEGESREVDMAYVCSKDGFL